MKARSPITITISLGICTVLGAYCWKQDGLNYRVSLRGGFDRDRNIVSQRDKSALINLASSMANESPIQNVR